jgi:GAF domain-containing protein
MTTPEATSQTRPGANRQPGVDRPTRPLTAVPDSTAAETPIAAIARAVRAMQGHHDSIDRTLLAAVAAAADVTPGATSAAVSLADRGEKLRRSAGSDELARKINAVQAEAAEGPAFAALRDHCSIRIDDLTAEPRWPTFTPRAAAAGAASLLSFWMSVEDGSVGVLTLCATVKHAFTDPSEQIGSALATHAAATIAGAQHEAGLQVAADHRDLIGQAKGIVMERYKMTGDEAFTLLARASQFGNLRLYEVAKRLVATGDFPSTRPRAKHRPAGRRGS